MNHIRLSPANSESRAHQIKDGDILQLGVDYQGGTEDMYKSVKIKIEVGREWQASANAFKYVCSSNSLEYPSILMMIDPAQTHLINLNRWLFRLASILLNRSLRVRML